MPPHARMSLVQQLLLRALVARFWAEPYRPSGWRAGAPSCTTASCCRTSSGQDFARRDRRAARAPAIAFELDWFAPHLEFRFPLLGDFAAAGVDGRAAHGARALARAGRGERRRRHGALRRFVGRAASRCKVARAGRRAPRARPATAGRVPLQPTGTRRRVRRRRALPRLAPRRRRCIRPSPCTRRSSSTSSTPGWTARSAAASTTSPIRAAATTRPSRSTPTRPRARRLARFFRTGHTPGTMTAADPRRRTPTFRTRSICAARRGALSVRLRSRCWINCSPATRRPRALRRAARRARPAAAALGRVRARARRAQRARGERHAVAHRAADPRARHHLQRLRRRAGRAPAVGGRSDPAVLPADEWQAIAAGIEQRADLLNRVLGDLYGAQTLLKSGAIPPPVIFGHRGFLAPGAGHAAGRRHATCCSTPPTWRARPTAAGGSSATARRRLRARATRSRTGSSSRASFRRCSASCRCSTWPSFFDALRDVAAALGAARRRRRRASCCSRRGRTTRPTSSTPCSRATSASRSSKAATSRCATTASG